MVDIEYLRLLEETVSYFEKNRNYEVVQVVEDRTVPAFHILVFNVKHEEYEIYYMGHSDLDLCFGSYDEDMCDAWLVNHSV